MKETSYYAQNQHYSLNLFMGFSKIIPDDK